LVELFPASIDREFVRRVCGNKIYERGRSYFLSGMVVNAIAEGDTLIGEVKGSRVRPYNVSAQILGDTIIPDCDCPHEVPFCKHVCALLLAWIEAPNSFRKTETVAGLEADVNTGLARDVDEYGVQDLEFSDEEAAPIAHERHKDRANAKREAADQLREHTLEELKGILRYLGLPVGNKAKEEYVDYLANLFTDPAQIRTRILSLGKEERLILDIIHLVAGAQGLTLEELQQRLKNLDLLAGATRASAALQHLFAQGLVARVGHSRWDGYGKFRVPDAVASELSVYSISHLLSSRRYKEETLEITSRSRPVDETLHLVWRYFAEHKVVPRYTAKRSSFEQQWDGLRGWRNSPDEIAEMERQPKRMNTLFLSLEVLPPPPPLQDADLNALASITGGDENEALFLYHLLDNLSALKEKERIFAQEDRMREFLRLSRSRRLEELVRTWLKMDRWCELSLFSSIAGKARVRRLVGAAYLSRREFLQQLVDGQRFLINVVSRLEENKWYSVNALLETLRALRPDFLMRSSRGAFGNRPSWWFQSVATDRDLDPSSREDWRAAEGQYIVGLLRGPLLWMGIIDLAYVGGKLEAFRTRPLASLLSGRAPLHAEGEEAHIEVGADLSVAISPGIVDAKVHGFLEKLGVLVEATPTRFRYRLTPDRVGQAFEEGFSIEDISSFLHKYGAPISTEMRQALEKWRAGYGLVRLYDNLTVVEFADDYALREIRACTSIEQYIIFEFSPRLVAVQPEFVDVLAAEMTRKGYTPKIVEGEA